MQQDRYCRNCGQELQPEDRFCANCGSPVHATAHVPTPEADVYVPPPPQAEPAPQPPQTAERAATPPPRSQQERQGVAVRARGPILLFLASMLVLSVLSIATDPLATHASSSVFIVSNLAALLGGWIAFIIGAGLWWIGLSVVVYLIARLRGKRPLVSQVVFNWWVVLPVVVLQLFGGFLDALGTL